MLRWSIVVGVGDIVAAKYKVERTLEKGGMGYVVAARHLQLDQPVAIKFLVPELMEREDAVARFLREARASVRIRSEHVVRVLDVGTLDDGTPFMVMEFLEGRDLAKELEDRKNLPVSEAIDYVLQVCEGLAEAHALGIVHRDLKPANLFHTRKSDGSDLIKILDFGISKALIVEGQPSQTSLTAMHGVMGSPHYMSPEQVRRPKDVDTRSDIWSLGVILHEFLAGAPPFACETPMAIMAAVVSEDPPEIRWTRSDVPEELQTVVSTCLAKEPSRRYADVVELAMALKRFAPGTGDASVNRISAILHGAKDRSSRAPKPLIWPSDGPTLESGNPPSPAPDERPRHTAAGWGTSHAGSPSRTRLVATITGAGLALAFAAALGYSVRVRSASTDRAVTGTSVVVPSIPVAALVTATPPSEKPASGLSFGAPAPNVVEALEAGAEPAALRASSAAISTVQATAHRPAAATSVTQAASARPPALADRPLPPKRDVAKANDGKPPVVDTKASDPLYGRR